METIFKVIEKPVRVLPYARLFQIAVTFEIDSTKYEIVRLEFSFFDWLSAIGGLSSIVLGASTVISALESPQRYVTAALIGDRRPPSNDPKRVRAYTQDEMKIKCMPGLQANAIMRRWVPRCCFKPACGSRKARLLGEAYEGINKSFYVHNIVK